MKVLLGILVLLVLFVVLPVGCASLPNEQTAESLLRTSGFSHIQYVGRAPYAELLGCGKNDTVLFTFHATNPAHKRVTVHVCQGWPLKGATIRN